MSIQCLTFQLNQNLFTIPIEIAKEVLEYKEVTPVPNMPSYMKGMISLRGEAVALMDLKNRISIEGSDQTKDTAIVILDLLENVHVGILVDAVCEVLYFDEENIQHPPNTGLDGGCNPVFIKGLIEIQKEKFAILLDINKIFSFSKEENAQEVLSLESDDPLV